MSARRLAALGAAALAPLLAGCGSGGTGTVQVFVAAEDTIAEGLRPGTAPENVSDGWAVSYSRYLVSIAHPRAARSDGPERLDDPGAWVLDLRHAPAEGYVIATFEDALAVRWDRFGFDLPNAKGSPRTLAPTTAADAELMVEHGWSVYFEGSITKPGGRSCRPTDPTDCVAEERVDFAWGLPAGTSYDDCATDDGLTGFAVPAGAGAQIKPTIHGDHWFFDNITSGAEITRRYAQYIADADLDRDGRTTIEELQAVRASDVFYAPTYNVSGAIGGPIETAYDFVVAEARTLGDFQGDGECPTRRVLP